MSGNLYKIKIWAAPDPSEGLRVQCFSVDSTLTPSDLVAIFDSESNRNNQDLPWRAIITTLSSIIPELKDARKADSAYDLEYREYLRLKAKFDPTP